MKTLLTGATGLLGANLTHLLCSQGVRPRLLIRETSDRRGLQGLSYEEAPGDIFDPVALRTALQGVTHLYHVAGIVRFDPFSRKGVARTNTQGTQNVLEAARAAGVKRVVIVSSVAAVGHGTLDRPATKDSVYNYAGDNPYHQSKREAEKLALAFSDARMEYVNTPFLQALTLPAYASSSKAERELGYRPRPVRLGIREALRWFQEEGMVSLDKPLAPRDAEL